MWGLQHLLEQIIWNQAFVQYKQQDNVVSGPGAL